MKKTLVLLIGCLAIGNSAIAYETAAQKAAKKKLDRYNQTGTFENCINYKNIKKSVVIDNNRILFELRGNKTVLNTMDNRCESLEFERQFNYAVRNSKLCAKDVIYARRDTCMLSQFEVLEKKS
ncbi:hypothetical protein [Pseudemcibacter aquimaris]|uniref:hypothetical protein n=1 Tax=Pseudemcibacter aquimaris TaxID=2857064 RepID=UPI0020121DFE|nr:hypothetical protein [Pseudemcibacter aquimaris]MCC3860480.1 hypothetical protein [Pseudemcibacter aquimaris]WDU59305.1 hypothetical protein KW060_03385 [Pseudemcibacter aquimaris]